MKFVDEFKLRHGFPVKETIEARLEGNRFLKNLLKT